MRCPTCSSSLRRIRAKRILIDFCPRCKSIWFDEGEFVDFVKALSVSDKVTPEKVKLFERRDVRSLYKIEEQSRICPKCDQTLRKFNYSYDSNVFLDKCPDCGGMWADKGEALRIAAYLKDDPNATMVGRTMAQNIQTFYDISDLAGIEEERIKAGLKWFLFFPRVIVPFSDDAPRSKFPGVTVSLIALCVLMFLVRVIFKPESFAVLVDLLPDNLFATDLIGSMFLTAGPLAIVWNVLFLWLFGDNVEDRLGHLGYLGFYLVCGLFAGILYVCFRGDLSFTSIGISGAVSGIMGAYFLFYPTAKIKIFCIYKIFEVPAVVCLGAWFVYPLLSESEAVTVGVCAAQIGGFLLGMSIAFCKKINE